MRVAVIYPPIMHDGKYPLLGQNRQFRYSSSNAVRIYPIVPATAATLAREHGFDTLFLDGINTRMTPEGFRKRLLSFKPDAVMLESKTPIIQDHWDYIHEIKTDLDVVTVLVGDHPSYNPKESLEHSETDYVVQGGDYDVGFLSIIEHLRDEKPLVGGIWYREGDNIVSSGSPYFIDDLDRLPFIDRDLTGWENYGEAYLYKPCTYIMSGRGCGGGPRGIGSCTFCSWQHNLWQESARLRSPENVVEEIESLVDKYGVREIFDDNESSGIWDQKWLEKFHTLMKDRDLIGRVILSSNSRADNLDGNTCKLLKSTGFRLLKVGLESGNPATLEKIDKKERIQQIIDGVKTAKDHGLVVMLTTMTGYPWESEQDAMMTYKTARELMLYKTRFGDSLQSSVVVAYPGTPLNELARKKGWFRIDPDDYRKYDMSVPVLKSKIDAFKWCDKIWSIHKDPRFMVKSFLSIHSIHDIKLAYTGLKSITAHTKDF